MPLITHDDLKRIGAKPTGIAQKMGDILGDVLDKHRNVRPSLADLRDKMQHGPVEAVVATAKVPFPVAPVSGPVGNAAKPAVDPSIAPRPMFFRPPIKGPSGASILSYLWNFHPIRDTIHGGIAKRSDWGSAETNHSTGRRIVHQFRIQLPGGTQEVGSIDTAAKMLGYPTAEDMPAEIRHRVFSYVRLS